VLSQKKLARAPGAMGVASEMLVGGACLLAMGGLQGETSAMTYDPRPLLAWGSLVTAGSLAAFSAYMYLLSKVSPALASSYAYVNPVIAVLLGVWLANESLGARELAAMAIILGSVLLLTTAKTAAKPVTAERRNQTQTGATATSTN